MENWRLKVTNSYMPYPTIRSFIIYNHIYHDNLKPNKRRIEQRAESSTTI
jgi:hypothetical protein